MKKLFLLALFSFGLFIQTNKTNSMGSFVSGAAAGIESADLISLHDSDFKANLLEVGIRSWEVAKLLTVIALFSKAIDLEIVDKKSVNKHLRFLSKTNALLAIANTINFFIIHKKLNRENCKTIIIHLLSSLFASYRLWQVSKKVQEDIRSV